MSVISLQRQEQVVLGAFPFTQLDSRGQGFLVRKLVVSWLAVDVSGELVLFLPSHFFLSARCRCGGPGREQCRPQPCCPPSVT